MLSTRVRIPILVAILAAAPAVAEPISAPNLSVRLDGGDAPLILDVRTEGEYRAGHVPGAVNIPHTELRAGLSKLPTDRGREIVIYCEVGGRAAVARNVLENAGFTRVRNLEGHMRHWRGSGYPLQ